MTRVTATLWRALLVALAVFALAACHSRVPRPGKPTAAQAQLRVIF